jgi:hypothetical protein
VSARCHLIAGLSTQHRGDVGGAEALADTGNARQDFARDEHRLG